MRDIIREFLRDHSDAIDVLILLIPLCLVFIIPITVVSIAGSFSTEGRGDAIEQSSSVEEAASQGDNITSQTQPESSKQ